MAKRRSETRNGNGRRDFARFVLMVLPGFMFVGLLAPAAVSVKPKAEERYEPVSFRSFTPRRPMQLAQISRPVASRETAVEVALEPLFSGARYVGVEPEREIALPAVEAGARSGEEIVLAEAEEDAVDDYVSEAMLDDSMDDVALSVDLTPLWDASIFDRIPGPLSTGGYTQYDDFHGGGFRFVRGTPVANPVPEPESAALLAVGLVLLALRERSR